MVFLNVSEGSANKAGYTITKCYCALVLPGPEHKGMVYLRRVHCLDKNCPHCTVGDFYNCQDPTGEAGDWVPQKLKVKSECRSKGSANASSDRGFAITVSSFSFYSDGFYRREHCPICKQAGRRYQWKYNPSQHAQSNKCIATLNRKKNKFEMKTCCISETLKSDSPMS